MAETVEEAKKARKEALKKFKEEYFELCYEIEEKEKRKKEVEELIIFYDVMEKMEKGE